MKNRFIYAIIISLALISSGCSDFLDTKPYSNTVVDNFYKTANDAELALTGCYQIIVAAAAQGEWGRGSFNTGLQSMLDGGTDECITREGLSDPLIGTVQIGSFTAQDDIFKYTWSFLFKGISRTNFLLERIDAIDMDKKRKEQIKAEASFLRGFFYYYLGTMYGGAPVYTTSKQDAAAPRNTLQEVFTRVLEDLDVAYKTLPGRSSIKGRANMWSAAGFMVKTYCYLASCKTNNVGGDLNFSLNSFQWVNENECYQTAKTISQDIIDNSGYVLTKRYDYLFRETTEDAQYEECLFTGESTSIQAAGNDYGAWLYYMIPVGATNVTGGGYGWLRPTGEMYYDLYDSDDPRRKHNIGGALVDKADAVEYVDGVKYYVPQPSDPSLDTYCITKFRYRDPTTKKISMALSEGNYPILRFADILLLNAEAEFFTGNEGAARERLNDLRERVSFETLGGDVPKVEYFNTVYKRTDFVRELLEERSRELCFEAHRRTDLIRFGRIHSRIAELSDGKQEGRKAHWNSVIPILQENWSGASHRVWFPLPINDVLTNKNLVQNPKYQSR